MNAKKLYLLIGVVLIVGLLPQENVSADMGPKPTMEFDFKLEDIKPDEIVSIKLMECGASPECENEYLFEERFPEDVRQYFRSCGLDGCSFSYYDFDEYHRLAIQLSNGNVLKSNVFENSYFDSRYKVLIQPDLLIVKELRGSNVNYNILALVFIGGFLICPGIVLAVLIVSIGIFVSGVRKKINWGDVPKRLGRVFFWGLMAGLAFTGVVLSPVTFILTLAIEITLTLVYWWYLKLPDKKLLYGVLIANIFTQPIFVLLQADIGLNIQFYSLNNILIAEAVIWLVEAVIIYLVQKRELPFRLVLALAFILNAASFGVGLLLPI